MALVVKREIAVDVNSVWRRVSDILWRVLQEKVASGGEYPTGGDITPSAIHVRHCFDLVFGKVVEDRRQDFRRKRVQRHFRIWNQTKFA